MSAGTSLNVKIRNARRGATHPPPEVFLAFGSVPGKVKDGDQRYQDSCRSAQRTSINGRMLYMRGLRLKVPLGVGYRSVLYSAT